MDVVTKVLELNGFGSLNPAQAAAADAGLVGDRSMIIAAPTASGKTLAAEIAALDMLSRGRRVIYIVPLKALASEKHAEFKEKFEPLGYRVALSIGDLDSSDQWLSNYDLIIVTSEKMDSLLRHNISWSGEIGLVIADEIHLLNDPGRGPTLEMVLTKLRQICSPRVLGLSATISNYEELASWLDATPVHSDYRPVMLYSGVCFENVVNFNPQRVLAAVIEDPIPDLMRHTVAGKKQMLVFVSTRRSAESVAEKSGTLLASMLDHASRQELGNVAGEILHLDTPTKQCQRLAACVRNGTAFHHAGLTNKQRGIIERAFRDGTIKMVSATPTLCLHENTSVWSGMKDYPVNEISDSYELHALNGNKIKSISPIEINENISPGNLVQIITKTGKRITLTRNHHLLVKKNNEKKLIRAEGCKRWGKIATVGYLKAKTNTCKWSDFIKDNKIPFNDSSLDLEIYYLIGVFLGDGYSGAEMSSNQILYKGSPMVVNEDDEVIKGIKSICDKHGIYYRESKNRYGTRQIVLTKANWFREFLVRCGVDVSIRKHVAKQLLHSDNESLSCLLRGLFDTDGYVQKGRNVGISTISPVLASDVQKSLLRYGIITRMRLRRGKSLKMHDKQYTCKDYFEITLAYNKSLERYHDSIGFGVFRKSQNLKEIVDRIRNNLLTVRCDKCDYVLHPRMFIGRTKSQLEWGRRKENVVKLLGERGPLKSSEMTRTLGYCPRKRESRLNHHYELIRKTKFGANEWVWELNDLGGWIYDNIISMNKDLEECFKKRCECPLCGSSLTKKLRNNWRGNDFDGDIFWDRIKDIVTVADEGNVYDVVLPSDGTHDHLFAANGFFVHNSAGINMPAYRVIIRDLKRFGSVRGMDYIPILEIQQMCGRAGRPKYDEEGEAILIAKNKAEAKHAWDNYVMGQAEDITSKLGVEPVLRTHVLALVSSGTVTTRQELYDFFAGTFYAHQYKDLSELNRKLDKMLLMLSNFNFITVEGGQLNDSPFMAASNLGVGEGLQPTRIGRRVSELYIDPITADAMIKSLEVAKGKGTNEFGYLHVISDCREMSPKLSLRKNDYTALSEMLAEEERNLLKMPPSPWELDYDGYMRSLKTALMFRAWIEESTEEQLMEDFGVAPGELRVRLSNADWLLYSLQELGLLLNYKEQLGMIRKTRLRVKYGISEELVALIKLKGIGRVKARRLHNAGIRKISDIMKAPKQGLEKLLGPKTAEEVLKQV